MKGSFYSRRHTADISSSLTYSSVISCEFLRIALTIVALNNLDILA